MSARRKNSKALKIARQHGLMIDGNFIIPYESFGPEGFQRASLILSQPHEVDEPHMLVKSDAIVLRRAAKALRLSDEKNDPTPVQPRRRFRRGLPKRGKR